MAGKKNCNELVLTSATLYIPTGTKSLYKETNGWKRFTNIVEMEGLVPVDEGDSVDYGEGVCPVAGYVADGG
jgi:hypothetical protein